MIRDIQDIIPGLLVKSKNLYLNSLERLPYIVLGLNGSKMVGIEQADGPGRPQVEVMPSLEFPQWKVMITLAVPGGGYPRPGMPIEGCGDRY